MDMAKALDTLTARCYDPRIEYDHELDQWVICFEKWTSGCSKDSPVEYCHDANEIESIIIKYVEILKA